MDFKLVKQLPGTLYSAVIMELFERLAYYGMVLVLGIYIVDNLGIPADLYGWVYGLFTGALYLLPLVAGALADRFGYKPALVVAFATLTAGYFLLGTRHQLRPRSAWPSGSSPSAARSSSRPSPAPSPAPPRRAAPARWASVSTT